MASVEELREDVKELVRLEEQAVRQHTKGFLTSEIRRLETVIAERTNNAPAPIGSTVTASSSSNSLLPTVKLTTYAFDQSDKFVKLYLTVAGIDQEHSSNVTTTFKPKSVSLLCKDIGGKNYTLDITGLFKPIDPAESTFKLKKDTVLLMLKKATTGTTWDCVTEQEAKTKEKKSKPKFDEKEDPSSGLMKMMKDMYDEGDDDMKRTIRKAWHEAQDKKTGGGGMDF